MFVFRFIAPLLATLTLLAALTVPVTERLVLDWFRRDVEQRAQLVAQSVEDNLRALWQGEAKLAPYQKLFDKIAQDSRVLAVGLCGAAPKPLAHSAAWPNDLTCADHTAAPYAMLSLPAGEVMLANFAIQLAAEGAPHRFIVLHDLGFSLRRVHDTKIFFLCFTLLVAIAAALVTIATAKLTLRAWLGRLRATLTNPEASFASQRLPREFLPVVREVRQRLRALSQGTDALDHIKVQWTPQTLKTLLDQELPGAEIIIVSNREPYIHSLQDGTITLQRPASGVVTALEPVMRACGGAWVAHGSGSADRQQVDADDCLPVPPDNPAYTLRRVWLTAEEEQGYYYGFANEGLWPLSHIAFVRPVFRHSDWEHYQTVNRKFAAAVLAQAKTPNPVILVQDYHLALLPRYLREKLPDATILTFWHIPWPNPEMFSICPWREDILDGLLGSSVLGFHTQFHCQNFLDTADRFLESNINRDQAIVTSGGQPTLVRPYPISIAWPPEGLARALPIADCRAALRARHNLPPDAIIGVGVERFDYTKGILDRFLAVGELLRQNPALRGRFCFIQAAAPTRSSLPAYQAVQEETQRAAAAVNAEFGTADYQPIILLATHHEPANVTALFRGADLCVVSSLHDGMNLVAKEFVGSRDDEQGVLILSNFAGAAKELEEALLVNPYDPQGMAQAMLRAAAMSADEQRERMRLMRAQVRDNNVYHWAARILLDAAQLRQRAQLGQFMTDHDFAETTEAAPRPLKIVDYR